MCVCVSSIHPPGPAISVGFYPSLQFGASRLTPLPHYDLISFLLNKSVVSVVIYRGVVFFFFFLFPIQLL